MSTPLPLDQVLDSTRDTIKDDVLQELENFCNSGDDIINYYLDDLDRLVNDAIAKVEQYLDQNFTPGHSLIDYFETCGSEKSLDLIKDWDTNTMLANGTYSTALTYLHGMMEDNLGYMIACGLLGHGRGLWELFDNFPQLNTLV
jgi:hypothetical protein